VAQFSQNLTKGERKMRKGVYQGANGLHFTIADLLASRTFDTEFESGCKVKKSDPEVQTYADKPQMFFFVAYDNEGVECTYNSQMVSFIYS
jgi:hypothetical protein